MTLPQSLLKDIQKLYKKQENDYTEDILNVEWRLWSGPVTKQFILYRKIRGPV